MEEPQATPALQEFPQLQRLAMFSPATQGLIADYLAYLSARHYTPSVQEGTIRALKSFAVLMPAARQSVLYQDLTQTTPTDIDAWIEASFRHQLAPGTVATRLRVVQGLFRFLRDQGYVPQSPIRHPRHHILVPQDLPRPMAEEEVIALFRVIDAGCSRCYLKPLVNLTMLNFTSARDFGAGLSSGCTWSERDGPDV